MLQGGAAEPAFAGAAEVAGVGETEEEADFGDGAVAVCEEVVGEVFAFVVQQFVEGVAFFFQAALQGARGEVEEGGDVGKFGFAARQGGMDAREYLAGEVAARQLAEVLVDEGFVVRDELRVGAGVGFDGVGIAEADGVLRGAELDGGVEVVVETLAKLRVVVVATASDGSIDLTDLDAKLEQHADKVAGIMITYPSTHGIFEDTVKEVCAKVHAAGGQVYIDGANLNALAGVARPGQFGGDVSHLNLHKTFTIPHGGGGPGVGPVCVAEHLVPFLPTDPVNTDPQPNTSGVPVSSARYGSAGVLPISWAYIAMMGATGLTQATATAILNANYLAAELHDSFPVLYTGNNNLVAHECILDVRPLADKTGVSATDVAKRLVDYGFHAPTLSHSFLCIR